MCGFVGMEVGFGRFFISRCCVLDMCLLVK